MSDKTGIEWTDATWNPITGCTLVSEGCRNCYAAQLAATRLKQHPSRAGLARLNAEGVAKFTGEVRFNEQWLTQPLRWRKPRRIFVCAHGDLFHESVPDQWIDRVFAVMALSPQHIFQVLTKRPERMREMLRAVKRPGLPERVIEYIDALACSKQEAMAAMCRPTTQLPNVWLGVSVEDQATADLRIPLLLDTPAATRFVSVEPMLGPVNLTKIMGTACLASDGSCCGDRPWLDTLRGIQGCSRAGAYGFPLKMQMPRGLDWVIAGGESGPGARPLHPDWVRALRDRCAAARVPFFFKQWGAWLPTNMWAIGPGAPPVTAIDGYGNLVPPDVAPQDVGGQRFSHVGKKAAGALLDGVMHREFPA